VRSDLCLSNRAILTLFLAIQNNARPYLSSGAPQGSAEPSISPTSDGFASLITQHIQQVDDDNREDDESLISGFSAPVTSTWKRLPISQLFDFGSTHWSSRYAHFANITFEEELELYELLDLDADGEMDPDLDTTTQDVLLA